MANNFSGDSRIKALYRFESGALTTDSIGSNTLTNVNSAGEDGTNYKEGACAVNLVAVDSKYLYRTDENLAVGFPFKSGGANTDVMFACWYRPNSTSGFHAILAKWSDNGGKSWMVAQDGANFTFYYGYNAGANGDYLYNYSAAFAANVWHHISGWYSKSLRIGWLNIFKDSGGGTYPLTTFFHLLNDISVASGPFCIGASLNSSDAPANFVDGRIDEVVIGAGKWAPHEVDAIRRGEFDASVDGLAVYNLEAQVEYSPAPKAAVSQVSVEVLYTPQDPNLRRYSGSIGLNVTPSSDHSQHFERVGDIWVTVNNAAANYFNQSAHEKIYYSLGLPVTVTPSATLVRTWAYAGDIDLAVAPGGLYAYPDRIYNGSIPVLIEPSSITRLPTPGWDSLSGYGFVDIDGLSDPPPFWVYPSNLGFAFNPAASSYAVYALIGQVAEGGVVIGGYGVLSIHKPGIYSFEGEHGVEVGGTPVVNVVTPKIILEESTGGVAVAGAAIVKWVGIVTKPPVYAVVGKKGATVAGDPVVVFSTPSDKDLIHIADGGVRVGGPIRYPEVTAYRPKITDVLLAYVGDGGVEVGSDSCIKVLVPMTYTIESDPASVVVFGAGGVIIIRPMAYREQGEGGLLLGDEPGAEDAETWVITGGSKEPSCYTNFPFNSYAADDLRVLAAAADGIYQLGGDDDDGEQVHTGLRVTTNFGRDNKKRIRSVYCGDSGPLTEVRVESEGAVSYAPWDRDRFSVDCKVRGRELIIDVAEFDQISQFEVTPMEIAR